MLTMFIFGWIIPLRFVLTAYTFIMSVFCLIALSFFKFVFNLFILKTSGKKSACAMRQNTLIKDAFSEKYFMQCFFLSKIIYFKDILTGKQV